MSKKRAFVRYTHKGAIVPGGLIVTSSAGCPTDGIYKEVPVNYCCQEDSCSPISYGEWQVVTGGIAGDGVVLNDGHSGKFNRFTIVGPNDGEDDGWVYLKQYFPTGDTFNINYKWTSFDDGAGGPPSVDWPVYWTSSTEPTGIPGDLTVRVEDTPASGIWNITVPAGEWFAVGIYSDDSCCGRGFLQVNF